jgi:GH25 family lysozyme M1 (1,4-beta-N-acetylmuramidase)
MDPIIVDVYSGDVNGHPDWSKLFAAGRPWDGAILKVSEGANWDSGTWLTANWKALHDGVGSRLGKDFFIGGYLYARFADSPLAQVDRYMSAIARAGGFLATDMPAIIDVERADNPDCSAQQIVDCVSAIATHLQARTGKPTILYGGSLMVDKGITSRMSCAKLWVARYSASLPEIVVTRIGWSEEDLLLWQYEGTDGWSGPVGYPRVAPIDAHAIDLSAICWPAGLAWLQQQCAVKSESWLDSFLAGWRKLFS